MPNVLLGASVEDREWAGKRRAPMAALSAAGWRTFVSYEPALGPVDFSGWEFLNWLISGGESQTCSRPSHPHWHRQARDFSAAHRIPYFFKQWGDWEELAIANREQQSARRHPGSVMLGVNGHILNFPFNGSHVIDPSYTQMVRIGKKTGAALLDGKTYKQFPAAGDPSPATMPELIAEG
jgi:hypothetical protein